MLTGQRLCQSQSHQDSVLSALNQQRKDGLLCDVTLVAGEQKFHAHKAVLAACSDYFRVSLLDHLHTWMLARGLWVLMKDPPTLLPCVIRRICMGLRVYKKQVSVSRCSVAADVMEVTSYYVTVFRDDRLLKTCLTLHHPSESSTTFPGFCEGFYHCLKFIGSII